MQGGPTPAPPERHEATAPANRRKMKKQVSFSEQELNDHPDSTGKTWQLQYRADRSLATGLATRSACYFQIPKYPASESRRSYNLKHGPRKQDIAQVALHQHSEQQVRKVHIPKSMMDSSFLKHPDLTIGQRQYLWSIAKIYSTAYMQTYLNRQYPTWFRRHREQDAQSQSQKGTGLKICHENQIKPQHLHQRQSQNETRKMPSKQLTSSLAAASRAYEPKENKERLQSGALLKDRNKPQNNLKPKKRKTPRQKDLTEEPGVNDNVPEETALNKSMKAMSIKDEQEEGVSEDLDSRINENENEKQDPADTLTTADSIEKEKEDEQEDTAEAE